MQTQVHDTNNLKVGTNVARHTYRCQGLEVNYKLSFAQMPVPTATALAQGMVKVETVLSLVNYHLSLINYMLGQPLITRIGST